MSFYAGWGVTWKDLPGSGRFGALNPIVVHIQGPTNFWAIAVPV